MSAGWVAASSRGRLLTRRRLGTAGAHDLANAGSFPAAMARLAGSPYGRSVTDGMTLDDARRAVGAVCLWHLRVLAGWLPPPGDDVVRVFAGRFELVNIADRFAQLAGATVASPYTLGSLGVAWPRVMAAVTAQDVRVALTRSLWGDPGPLGGPDAVAALEARWARWLGDSLPDQPAWADGAAALVVAGALAAGRSVPPAGLGDLRRQLGTGWEGAPDLATLRSRLPRSGAWVLDDDGGGAEGCEFWRAEGRWWRRVDGDAAAMLRHGRPGRAMVAAAAARLLADAWRVQAALEAAAWGPAGIEAFDAMA